jgi:acyl-CoA thioester hydrolase
MTARPAARALAAGRQAGSNRMKLSETNARECTVTFGRRAAAGDFPYRITDNVRYADLDPNQHVNNAVYASYFETGRVTLMKDRSRGLLPDGLSWMMVRLDMHFRAELRWPGGIEMGLGLVKFGRTSVTFDQVVFSQGKCVASAQSVSVLIDAETHKPMPLTADIVAAFQPWLRKGVEIVQPKF